MGFRKYGNGIIATRDFNTMGATTLHVEGATERSPAEIVGPLRFGRLVGASGQMRSLYPLLKRLSSTDVPVVIEGETGTGKQLLAEVLHEEGPRSQHPFIVVDGSSLPKDDVDSYLFGREDPNGERLSPGCFEQADRGTLFIDDVAELSAEVQAKLLRVLERGELRRVGGSLWRKVDLRVLSATHRDLEQEVRASRFRGDLFYRLAVARVEIPPLRRREGDVAVLARFFWEQLSASQEALSPEFLERLSTYGWPGNVRELFNTLRRRIALGDIADVRHISRDTTVLQSEALHDPIQELLNAGMRFSDAKDQLCLEFEKRFLSHILAKHHGNVSRAAAASGIARRQFYAIKARQTR